MRTNHKTSNPENRPKQEVVEQTFTWWIKTKAPYFFKLFKEKIKRFPDYDPKWPIYFQSYGILFKAVQAVISEIDKHTIITTITLDKELKKTIKRFNKKIKNGKNQKT